jgi:hypothetical protein
MDPGRFGSSGWTRTSNPPINRRKTTDLPGHAAVCGDSPKREIAPVNIGSIDGPSDAAACRPKRRFVASKGQEKGNVKSG